MKQLQAAKEELEKRQNELQAMMERLEESKNMEAAERQKLEDEIMAKQQEVMRIQEEVELKGKFGIFRQKSNSMSFPFRFRDKASSRRSGSSKT